MANPDDLRYTKLALNNGSGAIPALGFGTLIPDPVATGNATKAALEAGFRVIDTAERIFTAFDVIVFGALLAEPLPHVPDWKSMARRQAAIYFDGLSGAAESQPRPKEHR